MGVNEFLPAHWAASEQVAVFHRVNEVQLTKIYAALDEMLLQMTPQTATWALPLWERAYGIPVEEDRSLAFRRSRLVAKLRGRGTSTVAMVRDVASSYTDMDVEVEEFPAQHRTDIRFVGTIDSPANIEELSRSLVDILPAHLQYRYQFLHNLGNMAQRYSFFINIGDHMDIKMEGAL